MTLSLRLAKFIAYTVAFCMTVIATIVIGFAIQASVQLADLQVWHKGGLERDYSIRRAHTPATFEDYVALEERLFADLRRRVLDDPAAADRLALSRYNPQSIVADLALDTKYNRSYELIPSQEPLGAVLLVHGLSDSPYSMRALAETFLQEGYYVLALRLPGHGTVPAALVDVRWQDWYGAVELAAKHAAAKVGPGKPFLAGGHSTGAALVTLYSVRALTDESLPQPEQLYLMSAAIGITPFAALTNIISSLAFIPPFEKSRWINVTPEYDPYKYNSFPVNAARQIHKLTRVLQGELDDLAPTGLLETMPRVHMYQSIVDSTVTANQVVRGLLSRLPARGHDLVIFDVNRQQTLVDLIAPGPLEDLERIRNAVDLPYVITLIANREHGSRALARYTRRAGASSVAVEELPFEWPAGVFSVGHVSLPFPVDDPVYGLTPATGDGPSYPLGSVAMRGESGALVVGLGAFARLRSNPFFDVIRTHVVATLATNGDAGP